MAKFVSSRSSASIVRPAVAPISARQVFLAGCGFSRSRTRAGIIGACASHWRERLRDRPGAVSPPVAAEHSLDFANLLVVPCDKIPCLRGGDIHTHPHPRERPSWAV